MPELWKEISPGVYRVESCLSRTRKVSTLELLAPANIWSRALQTEVELQNQCAQLEKLKNTISLLQKDLVELRHKLDKHCDKAKEATREALGKLSAKCEALRDNLKRENYNQYLASECRRKDTTIDRQKHSLKNEKAKTKATEKCLFEIRNKNALNRPATLYEILLAKNFCFKD